MKKTTAKKVTEVTEVKEVKEERMFYTLEFPDGSVIKGDTKIRQFQPNKEKGFHNSGYQVKVSDGDYSGNIMIIDSSKRLYI